MNASTPGDSSTLGQRIAYALALETRTQTAAESTLMARHPDVFRHRGFLSSYISGRRGKKTPDPAMIKILADFLHVEFEWLLLGTGPARRGGRGETPAETAMIFARTIGVREDAWEVAWERNKDRAESMGVEDWFNAIKSEAERLDRAGIPRPEAEAAKRDQQGKIRRAKQKKYAAAKEAPPALLVAEPKRQSYGGR